MHWGSSRDVRSLRTSCGRSHPLDAQRQVTRTGQQRADEVLRTRNGRVMFMLENGRKRTLTPDNPQLLRLGATRLLAPAARI